MSGEYLIVDDDPPVGFWRGARPAGVPDLSFRRLISLPVWRSPVSIDGGSENANGSITLDNGDCFLSEYWPVPPLRRTAQICRDEVVLVEGVITEVSVGAEWALTVES
jgi:hypothetical protein